MTEPESDALAKLREPFKPEAVGKLPRVTCKACRDSSAKCCDKHKRQDCTVCGNWMTTAHMHLDYVGHAEVTDRLLSVDPEWQWEPFAVGPDGLPAIKKGASGEWELWIKLTVCGVTRIGVGSVATGLDADKQLIGDALRNAAMRFGVALDLWSKAELESSMNDDPIPDATLPLSVRERALRLTEPARGKFGAWLRAKSIPTTPKDWTDANLVDIGKWLDHLASTGEALQVDAPTAPPAESARTAPSDPAKSSQGELGDVPAPEVLHVATDAPTSVPDPDEDPAITRRRALTAYVNGLDKVQLLAELGALNVKASRAQTEQRLELIDALLKTDWQPAAVAS